MSDSEPTVEIERFDRSPMWGVFHSEWDPGSRPIALFDTLEAADEHREKVSQSSCLAYDDLVILPAVVGGDYANDDELTVGTKALAAVHPGAAWAITASGDDDLELDDVDV